VTGAELVRNLAVAAARWTGHKLRHRELVDPRRYLAYLGQRLRRRPYSTVDAPPPEGVSRQQAAVWDATLRAVAAHRPRPYAGRVVALRARDDRRFVPMLDPLLGWRRLVLGGIETVDVPGDHATLLAPPNVHALAGEIRLRARLSAAPA
jgi:thioesterase domain-containing protein